MALNNELNFEYMKTEEKEQLQKEIDRLQSKLNELSNDQSYEVGKWYIASSGDVKGYLMLLNNIESNYGFIANYWFTKSGSYSSNAGIFDKIERPATNEEIQTALIAEAKRRGYKKGVTVNRDGLDTFFNGVIELMGEKFSFFERSNTLELGGNIIFKNGKWAEIIENPPLKINGHEMKVDGIEVKFGCAKFNWAQLTNIKNGVKSFNEYISSNRKISSIKLDSGVEITVEQLKQIVDELNKTK